MKYLNKIMVFFLFLLFGYGVDTFAYIYRITNKTDKVLKVQLYYTFFGTRKLGHPRRIEPNGLHRFVFTGIKSGLCLTKIMVWIKDSAGEWEKGKYATFAPPSLGWCGNKDFTLVLHKTLNKIVAF